MKLRIFLRIFIFILFLLNVGAAAGQDRVSLGERVAVLPLWYDADLPSGENLSGTVQTTIQFMLRYLPNYELVEEQPYPEGQSGLIAYGREQDLDSLIYGRVNQEGRSYSISLLLYSMEKDQTIAVKQGSIASSLGLFDLADRLSLEILEAYLDRPLVFGSVRFEPADAADAAVEDYRVLINGKPAGENLTRLPRFLAGEYQIRVDEILEDGRSVEAVERSVRVREGETLVISIPNARYADVQLTADGPDVPFTLEEREKGLTYTKGDGDSLALPAGSYTFTVTQPDYQGDPYFLDTVSLETRIGEDYTLEIPTVRLGRGFVFNPAGAAAADGRYAVYLDGELLEGDSIDVLPLGSHEIEVYQFIEGERLSVYEGSLRNGKDEMRTVEFPLFASKRRWTEYQRNRYPDFSGVLQGLDGAYAQAGIRWEGLQRRLGLAVLGGGYLLEGSLCRTAKVKAQWLPLGGGSRFSPELGAALTANFFPEKSPVVTVGPQLGIGWNTGHSILSTLFFENELRYTVGDELDWGGTLELAYYFSVGVRLF